MLADPFTVVLKPIFAIEYLFLFVVTVVHLFFDIYNIYKLLHCLELEIFPSVVTILSCLFSFQLVFYKKGRARNFFVRRSSRQPPDRRSIFVANLTKKTTTKKHKKEFVEIDNTWPKGEWEIRLKNQVQARERISMELRRVNSEGLPAPLPYRELRRSFFLLNCLHQLLLTVSSFTMFPQKLS